MKNLLKHYLGQWPFLFFPMYKALAPKRLVLECMLNEKSEIVIEGFPRSANTFSVVAFRQAQQRKVPMAHHLHAEAQILSGVRRGLPVIVLIRNPEESIRSLKIMYPNANVDREMKRYIKFYRNIIPVKDKVVIADFSVVTTDFGSLISKVNQRFGTEYVEFQHSEESVNSVYKEIEDLNETLFSGSEAHIGRPSRKRSSIDIGIDLESVLMREAKKIYAQLKEIT